MTYESIWCTLMNFKILNKAIQPEWMKPSTRYSAGVDLRACIDKPLHIGSGEQHMVGTGIAISIPDSSVGLVYPRSSWGKAGLVLANTVPVIDADFRGEIKLVLWNRNDQYTKPITINPLDRVAQLVVQMIYPAQEWREVKELDDTERGSGSFGSTGRE